MAIGASNFTVPEKFRPRGEDGLKALFADKAFIRDADTAPKPPRYAPGEIPEIDLVDAEAPASSPETPAIEKAGTGRDASERKDDPGRRPVPAVSDGAASYVAGPVQQASAQRPAPQPQGAPQSGIAAQGEDEFAARQSANERRAARDLTYLNQAAAAADSGQVASVMPTNMAAAAQGEAERVRAREDDYKSALDAARRQLAERIRELEERLAFIDQQVAEIDVKLEALSELEQLQRDGKLDPNNPAHRELLRRAGFTDEEIRGGISAEDIARRQRQYRKDRERWLREREQIQNQLRQEQQLAQKAEKNPYNPQVQAELLRLAETRDGVRQIGGAAAKSDKLEVRQMMASVVASKEAEPVRAISQNYTNSAAISTNKVATGQDSYSFDLNAPPPAATVTASAANAVAPTPINAPPLTPTFAAASDPAKAPVLTADNDDVAALLKPAAPGAKV